MTSRKRKRRNRIHNKPQSPFRGGFVNNLHDPPAGGGGGGGVPDNEPGLLEYYFGISEESLENLMFSTWIVIIILILYLLSSGGKEQKPILGLVGVETTYESADLRAALRTTWFPPHGRANFKERRMEFVFVIEKTKGRRMKEIEKENLKYRDILILQESEPISDLDKTFKFFKTASKKFDAEYYIKADEHIYLRPDRLAAMLLRKKREPLQYIGCQKEKRHINEKYDFVFAHGSLYVLSAEAVNKLIKANKLSLLKYKSSADVAVGYAMDKAMVKLEEQTDLCQSDCSPKFVAVSLFSSCSTGPCNPVNKLKELHTSTMCSKNS